MQSLIENYINGNLTTAKAQAKRHSLLVIRVALEEYGYSYGAAVAISDFLKGFGSFQAACDAEQKAREVSV